MTLICITPENNFFNSFLEFVRQKTSLTNDFSSLKVYVPSQRFKRNLEYKFAKIKVNAPIIISILDEFGIYEDLINSKELPTKIEQKFLFAKFHSEYFKHSFVKSLGLYNDFDKLYNEAFECDLKLEDLNILNQKEISLLAEKSKMVLEFILTNWPNKLKELGKLYYPDFIIKLLNAFENEISKQNNLIFLGFNIDYKPLNELLAKVAASESHMLFVQYNREEALIKTEGYEKYSAYFCITEFIEKYRLNYEYIDDKKLENKIYYFEADSLEVEANFIVDLAIKLREDKQKSFIVSNDNLLNKILLEKFLGKGIIADLTEGKSFQETIYFKYLTSIINLISEFNLVDFIYILKHEYTNINIENSFEIACELEINVIRKYKIEKFFDIKFYTLLSNNQSLIDYIDLLEKIFSGLFNITKFAEIKEIYEVFYKLLNEIAYSENSEVAQINEALTEIYKLMQNFNFKIFKGEFFNFLSSLLDSNKIYDYNTDQFIRIMSPKEATYIAYKNIIIANCNEEDFITPPKSLINNYLKHILGLEDQTNFISQQATIFNKLLYNSNVYLTRSVKKIGENTSLLRFVEILEMKKKLLKLVKVKHEVIKNYGIKNLVFPNPNADIRPNSLSVTKLELYLKDPYSVYAENILGLKPIGDLNKDTDKKDLGILVHNIIENLIKNKFNDELSFLKFAVLELEKNIEENSRFFIERQFTESMKWLYNEIFKKHENDKMYSELKVELEVDGFNLTVRNDLVIINDNIIIIDFKTGLLPTKKDVDEFKALQLTLSAIYFSRKYNKPIIGKYIKLLDKENAYDEKSFEFNQENIEAALEAVKEYINNFRTMPFVVNKKFYLQYNSPFNLLSRFWELNEEV